MNFVKDTAVDASGKTLNINVTDGTRLNAGISQITNADSHVKANKIVIKLDSKDASGTTHAIHQDKGNLTIDGDVDIDITELLGSEKIAYFNIGDKKCSAKLPADYNIEHSLTKEAGISSESASFSVSKNSRLFIIFILSRF